MNKDFDCDTGTLPLKRIRIPLEDTSRPAEPLALSIEEKATVSSCLENIQKLLDAYGSQTDENTRLLRGFGGFSFMISITRTPGKIPVSEISIWYHPKRNEPMSGHQSVSVLDAVFEGEKYYGQSWERGKEFHLYKGWQDALKLLLADPEEAEVDFRKRKKLSDSRAVITGPNPVFVKEENDRIDRGKDFIRKLQLVPSENQRSATG